MSTFKIVSGGQGLYSEAPGEGAECRRQQRLERAESGEVREDGVENSIRRGLSARQRRSGIAGYAVAVRRSRSVSRLIRITSQNPMKFLILSLALPILLLAGCAKSSAIRRYSESKSGFRQGPELMSNKVPPQDIYRIYHQAATGFVSIQSIRESAMERATQFCENQGRGILVLGEKSSQPPYILGNFPRIEIVFAAVDRPKTAGGGGADGGSYARLRELKGLLDNGTLTKDEFEREKRKVLSGQ
jgi:hypothetical protein